MTLIRATFGHSDGEIMSVRFEAGMYSACECAAHALAARLATTPVEYAIVRVSEGHVVKIFSDAPASLIVRETRAALRDARALWRARNRRAA